MELREGILKRRSVRGYLNKPVDKETILEVLELGTRAVSAVNAQPWEIVVATGDVLEELKRRNINSLKNNEPLDYEDAPIHGIYKERSRTIGKALLGAMEIKREDKERREWWSERGFKFFDAPVVVFLLMDSSLDKEQFRFDMGAVAQNICLAALTKGLGTCVEYQAIYYQKAARELLNIPEDKIFIAGIAMGYADEDFPANSVRSEREAIENVVSLQGF